MDYSDFTDSLNITLGDTANTTFTVEEKQRALDKAFNDDYVFEPIWDSSTTFAAGTYRYAKPSGVDVIQDVYFQPSTSDFPEPISADCWETVDGELSLTPLANKYFNAGDTIFIKGRTKLGTDATVSDVGLQEYILALAGYNTLTLLTFKKANLFLKNDTTMGELITLRRELEREVKEYRNRRPREWERG